MTDYICYACSNEGPGRKTKRGSGKAELWIYMLLLVPGPFYTLYRRLFLKRTCTHCGMQTVVRITSDQGQIAKRRLDMELGILPVKKNETPLPEAAPQPMATVEKREPKKPANPEEW